LKKSQLKLKRRQLMRLLPKLRHKKMGRAKP
jgi:hypothetical protein